MVKVTEKYLFRKISKTSQILPKKKGETDQEHLNRVTHLYLQSQFVDYIAPMSHCTSVSVVYLQNNQLQTIHNMENFPNLQYLYLQNNHISKIENLNCLKNLKKLYLGSNEISLLEGLDEMKNLTELHVENQRLPKGDTFYFDPRTVKNLGKTLMVLNVSQNNLYSIQDLKDLKQLQCLNASDNNIENTEEVINTLESLTRLTNLKLTGNPIAGNRKYKDVITLASKSLRVLDDKAIQPETRTFIENFATSRESWCRKSAEKSKTVSNSHSDCMKSQSRNRKEKNFHTISDSRLSPFFQYLKTPRTVSMFSANVPLNYFHESVKAFEYDPKFRSPGQN